MKLFRMNGRHTKIPAAAEESKRGKEVDGMTIGAWIMLILYLGGLGGGSLALIAYSLRKDQI